MGSPSSRRSPRFRRCPQTPARPLLPLQLRAPAGLPAWGAASLTLITQKSDDLSSPRLSLSSERSPATAQPPRPTDGCHFRLSSIQGIPRRGPPRSCGDSGALPLCGAGRGWGRDSRQVSGYRPPRSPTETSDPSWSREGRLRTAWESRGWEAGADEEGDGRRCGRRAEGTGSLRDRARGARPARRTAGREPRGGGCWRRCEFGWGRGGP